jgi:hypothetical protein
MATVGEYTAEIKLRPLPTTESYRIEVDAYYFGTSGGSPNTLKAFSHTYDWNLATEGVSEDHKLRITDAAIELDPVELLYWNEDATPAKTPLTTPAKVTLTQYDAVNGGQGAGAILDTETLYLPAPGAGQSHNFEITTGSARFSSSITKAGAGIEIQQDGNFAKLVATGSTPTAGDGVRILSDVIQLDIGGLTSLVPASPTLDSLVYWDQDLDSHKRVVIDQMPLTQFSNTGFTVNAEAVNAGTFPAGTWVFPSSSTIQVGSTTGDTPNIQFWDRDTSPGGYQDVINVPAALELDIGHSSWAVDILGSSVLVNGAAIGTVTSVTNATDGGITVTNSTTTPTLAVNAGDLPDFTAATSMEAVDRFVVHEAGVGSPSARQIAAIDIPLSIFNNNLGLGKNEAGAGITLSTTTVTDDTIALDYLGADSFIAVAPTGSIVASDEILFMDVNDTSNVKRDLVSSLPFTNNTGDVESVDNATNGGLTATNPGGPDVTLALAVDNLLDHSGTLAAADRFAVWESGAGTRKIAAASIGLNSFNYNLTLDASNIAQGQFATVSGTYTFAGAAVLQMGSNTLQPTLQFWDRDTVGGGYRDVITVPAVEELDIGSAGWAVDILGSSVLVNGAAIGTVSLVQNATNGGVAVTGGSGPTVDLALAVDNLADHSGTLAAADRFAVWESGAGTRKIAASSIALTSFSATGFARLTGSGIGLTDDGSTVSVYYAAAANNIIDGATDWASGALAGADTIIFADGASTGEVYHVSLAEIDVGLFDDDGTYYDVATGITEGDIVDGSILARVASNETILGNWTFNADTKVGDDDALQFGTGADYWFEYNSTGTQFEFWTTDNGAPLGTDALLMSVADGGTVVDFNGQVITPAIRVGGGAQASTGEVRLSYTDTIAWRNNNNTADVIALTVDATDNLLNTSTSFRADTHNQRDLGTDAIKWRHGYFEDITVASGLVTSVSEATNGGITVNPTAGDVLIGIRLTGTDNYILEAPDQQAVAITTTARIAYSDVSNNVNYGNVSDLPFTNNVGDVTGVGEIAQGGITVTSQSGPVPDVGLDIDNMVDLGTDMTALDRFAYHSDGNGSRKIAPANMRLDLMDNSVSLFTSGGFDTAGDGLTNPSGTTIALDYLGADSFIAVAPTGSIVASDEILFMDVNDTSNVKRDLVSSLPFTNNVGTVTAVTAGTGLDSSGGAAPNITLDLGELGEKTGALVASDRLILAAGGAGTAMNAETISSIPLGIFSNDQGWTTNAGTVTSVGSGIGLTGGPFTNSGTLEVKYAAGSNLIDGASSTVAIAGADEVLFRDTGDGVVYKDTVANLLAITHTHPASEITAGTFGAGAYTFTRATADTTPTVRIENTSGTSGRVLLTLDGESDELRFENYDTGDWQIVNSQQSNGIRIKDGTGWITFLYNGSEVVAIDSSGGLDTLTGGLLTGGTQRVQQDGDLVNIKDITATGNWTTTGTGPHSIGASTIGYYQHYQGGTFTSDGSSTAAAGWALGTDLIAANGDTSWLTIGAMGGSAFNGSITTQDNSETIGSVSTLYLTEPTIIKGATDTITTAATLYIANAPNEATDNYAIYVATGDTHVSFLETGAVAPVTTSTFASGSGTKRWSTVYTDDLDLTGEIKTGNGSLITPGYSFSSNTDSGMYLDNVTPALNFSLDSGLELSLETNQWAFGGSWTNNSATSLDVLQLRNTSGRMGILARTNTSSDFGITHAENDTAFLSRILFENATPKIQFQGSSGVDWMEVSGAGMTVFGSSVLGGTANNDLHTTKLGGFAVEDATPGGTRFGSYGVLHLNSNSNLTSGARQYFITNAIDANKFGIIRSTGATTAPSIDGASGGVDSGTVDFVIDNIGRVGIGTTSPGQTLEVEGTAAITGGGQALEIGPGAVDHVYMAWYADTAAPTTRSAYMGFGSAGTDLLTVENEQGSIMNFIADNLEVARFSHAVGTRGITLSPDDNDVFLRWDGGSASSGFMKRMTNQGGLSMYCDSSMLLHAGDNAATIETGLGIVAGTTIENLHLTADANVTILPGQQGGYNASFNTEFLTDGTLRFGLGGLRIVESGGAEMLALKDTGGAGTGANPYMAFRDSANTRLGYVGYGSLGSGDLFINNEISGGDLILLSAQVRVNNGTRTAPAIAFTNETDLGFYRIGTNAIGATGSVFGIVAEGAGSNVDFNMYQTTTQRMRMRWNNSVQALVFAMGTGITDRLVMDMSDGTHGRTYFLNTQVYNNEGTEVTRGSAGAVTLDWDGYNQVGLRNDGNIDTINIDDNSMTDGGCYVLVVRAATGVQASITFTPSGTLNWFTGSAPTFPLTVGNRTIITFIKSEGVTCASYWDAT